MKDSFSALIVKLVVDGDPAAVIAAIKHEYEFKCPAFIWGGPGHQSKHTCEYKHPHGIDDEHWDSYGYEWTGTGGFS